MSPKFELASCQHLISQRAIQTRRASQNRTHGGGEDGIGHTSLDVQIALRNEGVDGHAAREYENEGSERQVGDEKAGGGASLRMSFAESQWASASRERPPVAGQALQWVRDSLVGFRNPPG